VRTLNQGTLNLCVRAHASSTVWRITTMLLSCYAQQTRLARAVMSSKVLGEEDEGRGLSAHKRSSSSSALLQVGSTQLTGLYLMARNKSSGTGTRSSGGGSASNAARPGRGAGIYNLASQCRAAKRGRRDWGARGRGSSVRRGRKRARDDLDAPAGLGRLFFFFRLGSGGGVQARSGASLALITQTGGLAGNAMYSLLSSSPIISTAHLGRGTCLIFGHSFARSCQKHVPQFLPFVRTILDGACAHFLPSVRNVAQARAQIFFKKKARDGGCGGSQACTSA